MSILIIEHSNLTGSDRLGQRLLEDGHRLQVVRVHLGEQLPTDLDEIDGVISCGGPQDPTCDEPWVEQELNLLRTANKIELPVFGLCLGSQLLARALGGELSTCEKPEMGWYEVTLSPVGCSDFILTGQPWTGQQFQWHNWQVSTLPDGAVLLASSEYCKVQAWMIGINSYAVQYHPECTKERIESWIKDDVALLNDAGISTSKIEEDTENNFNEYTRLTDRLFDSISQILMPMHTRLSRQRQ
ncbi:MAG TPA: type 1 glutamine amidotransferase [Phycisphaerales bacterium]|jgi:GMP synthase-like glutamine amidotransferase|nr:type 1 glutamine amidotransferase [Phycisphaerales bacterium]HIB00560.1 type 1 glutamine amidotransferase [Phycisphaerales bacterium]HIB51222.1 type 1 glutamine amidotransferase [Phycisphaerales bacterium]HIN83574.1 type 1 glutamine amidotransferase [Phycisphaerales bacterium]HIO20492.1 type 1 glutamine amidotransferase [Phycisphaerales bacterium]